MNYNDTVRQLAKSVQEYVTMGDERPPFMVFSRSVRLKYGIGPRAICKILKEDYGFVVDGDKLVEG